MAASGLTCPTTGPRLNPLKRPSVTRPTAVPRFIEKMASAHSMISKSSAKDLERTYPSVASGSTHVTYCGVAPAFTRPDDASVRSFRTRHRLTQRPYALMVGERLGYGGYKNAALAFRADASLTSSRAA